MNFQIRSVNTRYDENNNVKSVQVAYAAKNEERTISVNGNLELSAEEYAGNESIEKLEEKAKNHLLNEINKDKEEGTAE
ncbi:hypothetical protein [Evansella clarkii]|uniref:hypothetical protein n=1 Tax=Evansella clarkii TaxID=79879 RepID=UPI000998CE4E|nr:hypothetical protein [Evansella clarkii]